MRFFSSINFYSKTSSPKIRFRRVDGGGLSGGCHRVFDERHFCLETRFFFLLFHLFELHSVGGGKKRMFPLTSAPVRTMFPEKKLPKLAVSCPHILSLKSDIVYPVLLSGLRQIRVGSLQSILCVQQLFKNVFFSSNFGAADCFSMTRLMVSSIYIRYRFSSCGVLQ
jgi:hypothetical protein